MKHLSHTIKVLLLLTLAACMKDKGNYDYRQLNAITIAGLDSQYVADYGKRMVIRPQLLFSQDEKEDTANYSYLWVADHLLGYTMTPDTIAGTRDLDTIISLSYGSYYMFYRVTDKRTGLFKDAYFIMTVTAPSYEGWMLLCDPENGNSRLDMVSKRGETDTLYRDVLSTVNSSFPMTGKPAFVATIFTGIDPGDGAMTTILATSERAALLGRDSLDYQPSFNLNNSISGGFQINNFTNAKAYPRIYSGMLWAENNLFTFGFSNITGPVNTQDRGTNLFKASPFIAVSTASNTIVFNEENKTFLRHPGSGTTCLTLPAGTLFDFSTGKDLVYMTYSEYNGGEVFAILKDPADGMLYLARFTVAGVQRYYASLDLPGIAGAEHFAVSPLLGYLFYNIGGKIYEYDFSNGKNILMKDYGSRKISRMEFRPFASTYPNAPNAPFYIELSRKLLVCTYEEGNLQTSGTLDIYTVPDINAQIRLDKSHTGTGKVVSIAYRER